ncbi:glycoside hydrolase family 3 C-terminal domain-containing protein [Nonomuraea sp. NPDC050556]|uniref:glycoside hydrolase family 3 C-terminal domain-containing protein n=1 Tax=Nonomuraea sp. NPDC050556 TaxID=3364369 RepID=UPI003798F2B8
MKRSLAALLLLLPLCVAATQEPPFHDTGLPIAQRVDDLLGRLTLAEKVSLLHQYQPAIPRLGIGLVKNGTEALHGVGWSNDVDDNGNSVLAEGTVFPQAIGLASTWDPELLKRVGAATGDEARGYNAENPRLWGLNLWAPVVDLLRDPRAGRNEEGYSEDPLLTGAMSTAYTSGLSGGDRTYLKTAPLLKHFIGYNNETSRDVSNSSLRPRVMNEYQIPAFRTALAAGTAHGVMTSYNLVNGRPSTVTDLNATVRSWAKGPVMNVSDAYAPGNLTGSQAYFATPAEGAAAMLKAGNDSFTDQGTNPATTLAAVNGALERGLITEADVDSAVSHVLTIRFRLGEFDPDGGPYAKITKDVVNSPAHKALNREAATRAMVLLKNEARALPLARSVKKVAVIGPLSDFLYGDWYGGRLPYQVTPVDGIKAALPGAEVTAYEAVDKVALKTSTGKYVTFSADPQGGPVVADAAQAGPAQTASLYDWGGGPLFFRAQANGKYMSWAFDGSVRNDQDQPNGWFVQQGFTPVPQADGSILLSHNPGWGPFYLTVTGTGALSFSNDVAQAEHFTMETLSKGADEAVAAAKDADEVVVVAGNMPFVNGRETDDRESLKISAKQDELISAVHAANRDTTLVLESGYPLTWSDQTVPAVLWTSHGGPELGNALASVLFGASNPGGRLTQTWYRSEGELPGILDYDIIKNGVTYLYYQGKPLYPFGHGLSYTSFAYEGLKVAGDRVSVKVTNTGSRTGDEVVQLYTHQHASRVRQPVKQLRAFERVTLGPGQSKKVVFTLKKADLALWDVTRNRFVTETATHDVLVGSSSAAIRQRTTMHVNGETIPPRDLTRVTRAADFDDYSGVELVDETKASDTAVGASTGDWISFGNARLGRAFTAGVASASGGSIELRLGSPTGTLLGMAQVAATGGAYQWGTASATVGGGTGDLYLVFRGDLRIKDFALAR